MEISMHVLSFHSEKIVGVAFFFIRLLNYSVMLYAKGKKQILKNINK
jgi:hypothetical protein